MSSGLHLLNKLLSEEDDRERLRFMRQILDARLSEEHFLDEKVAAAYKYVCEHFLRYGVVPQAETVQYETGLVLPNFPETECMDYWINEVITAYEMAIVLDSVEEVAGLVAHGEIRRAKERLLSIAAQLADSQRRKTRYDLEEVLDEVVEAHNVLQRASDSDGVQLGFPYIDAVTGGAQRGDFWVLLGDTGSGKTYILCRAAQGACDAGKRVLFLSLEMGAHQITRRLLSLGAHVDGTHFRLNRLSHYGVARLMDYASQWKRTGAGDRFQIVEGNVSMTVDDILFRVRESKPDVLFIDGAYMLKPDMRANMQRWEAVMASAERLKMIALTEKIPIVATFQFQRDGAKKGLKGIGYSYAIAQLASVVLAIENEENRAAGAHAVDVKHLTLLKGREGERGKIAIRYDMRTSTIEQDRVIEGMCYDVLHDGVDVHEDGPADDDMTTAGADYDDVF